MHPNGNEYDGAAGLAKLAVEAVSSAKLLGVKEVDDQYVVTFGPNPDRQLEPARVLDEFERALNQRQFIPTERRRGTVNFSQG
jgi:hypothetical protein